MDELSSEDDRIEYSEYEDRSIEFTQSEQKKKVDLKEKKKKTHNKEQSRQDLRSNIQVVGMPEGKGQASGAGKAFKEIMAKNFPDWKKPTNLQMQETE